MASSSSLRNDVFLSFRGIDTRRIFVGHLHKALDDRGIVTFKDDVKIKTGEPFPEAILTAIQNSTFAIIVISKNFTSSKWCLIELRKIMELWSEKKLIVFPIFYGVEPSDVRKEKGRFWKPLNRHRRPPFADDVPKWKDALTKVSHLNGKDPNKFKDDASMIEDIVGKISTQLSSMLPIDFGDVVGMLPHMERFAPMLNNESDKEVRMIGIWGMGGIGKTTIAKHLSNQYSRGFSARCFIGDVGKISRTYGLVGLQEKFVSSILPEEHIKLSTIEHGRHHIQSRLGHKRVFVVLDGVDTVDQIRSVAKKTSIFGQGSRIIITTRDKSLLKTCGFMEENLYEVHCLESDDSLLMFKRFAFEGGISPSDAHEQLSIRASQLAHGLPYAIEAFGLCFHGKITTDEWEAELRTLETTPHEKTMKILKISYKGLGVKSKAIFCHVACLFNGDPILQVRALLDDFDSSGIEMLADKSLLKISTDGHIKMHVLVEQTGKEIVREESNRRPRKQLILWDPRETCKVLIHNSGTDQIQSLALHICEMSRKLAISGSNFRPLYNLKILKFYKHLDDIESKLQFISEDHLLPLNLELRLLHWDANPLKNLPFDLHVECLVEINLRNSSLKSLWDGTPELWNLRRLDVTGSKHLRELPDISKAKKLEDLLMDGCTRLEQFPRYIGSLSNMVELHAIHCDGLQSLQIDIRAAKTLQEPNIMPCQQFILEFPNEVESLQSLANLSMEGKINFGLGQLQGDADHFFFYSGRQIIPYQLTTRSRPPRMSSFCDIKCLKIKRNSYNEGDPIFRCHDFSGFPLLTELNLINLKIENIPSSVGELKSLERLNLSGNDFKKLPKTMEQLSNLKYMDLCNCCKLEALPSITQVETLILSNCINLQSLLEVSTLEEDCGRLLELGLDNCNNVQSLSKQLSHFTNLKELDLSRHDFVTIPDSIKELSSLRTLTLNNCKKLESLEELPLSLKYLNAQCCCLLRNLSLSFDHSLEDVDLHHCFRLKLDDHVITRLPPNRHGEKVPRECSCSQATKVQSFLPHKQATTNSLSISLPQIKPSHMVLVKAICFLMLVTISVKLVLSAFY